MYKAGMRLADYMQRHKLSDLTVGEAVGVSRATISRLRRGKMVPSFDLATRIYDYTGRQVAPNDYLVSDAPPVRRTRPARPARLAEAG